jgi:type I restriction enzyme S subunit
VIDRRGVTPIKLGSSWVQTGHRVLSAKHIKDGRINLALGEDRFVDDATYARWMSTPLLPGDVLLTSEAPLGEVAQVTERLEWCLGQRLFGLRPQPDVLDGRFLSYLLRHGPVADAIQARASGTTVQGIRQAELVKVEVALPSLRDQRAVARLLGALDDKIEANRRMNETLEAMARALFRCWFVDFDPVRAKAEGRAPAGMDPATAALFTDGLEESEAGKVPRGWQLARVLEVADLISGGTPKTSVPEYWGGDIKWASAKDVSQCGGFFLMETERTITDAGVQSSSTKVLPADCVVIVARGATCGRFTVLAEPMAMNQTCYALRAKSPAARWFLRFCAEGLLERLVAQAHGSVFDTITTSTFDLARVVAPPSAVLSAFEACTTPLLERVRSSQTESATLAALRDGLLPKLLSGELHVREAERAVEAVA